MSASDGARELTGRSFNAGVALSVLSSGSIHSGKVMDALWQGKFTLRLMPEI